MNAGKAKEVAAWLNGLDNKTVRNVRPVKVIIPYKGKEQTFYGARYQRVGHYTESMDGVRQGRYKAGDEYTDEMFYLLGDLPVTYKKKIRVAGFWEQRIVYNIPGDTGDWYVNGYWKQTEKNAGFAHHHPFGNNFGLSRWDHEGLKQRIDHYESQRERISIVVEAL